jgi:hypothetical protein
MSLLPVDSWIDPIMKIGLTAFGSAALQRGGSWVTLTAISFIVAYAAASLALEVVDSATMAIFVSFAEHPASLRAHFPIVHHRFVRVAEFSPGANL